MLCSWVKRFFENDFHDWKVIPLFLIGKNLGKNFKFHNNIDINNDILSKFSSSYQDIFIKCINNYTSKPTLPSMILSDFIWFNSNIKVDSKPVHFSFFSDKNVPWKDLKIEFHLNDTHKIYWLQIIDAMPKTWKDIILKEKGNAKNLVIFDHHIVRKSQICSLKKLKTGANQSNNSSSITFLPCWMKCWNGFCNYKIYKVSKKKMMLNEVCSRTKFHPTCFDAEV